MVKKKILQMLTSFCALLLQYQDSCRDLLSKLNLQFQVSTPKFKIISLLLYTKVKPNLFMRSSRQSSLTCHQRPKVSVQTDRAQSILKDPAACSAGWGYESSRFHVQSSKLSLDLYTAVEILIKDPVEIANLSFSEYKPINQNIYFFRTK